VSHRPTKRRIEIQSAPPDGLEAPEQRLEANGDGETPTPVEAESVPEVLPAEEPMPAGEEAVDWQQKYEEEHDLHLRAEAELRNYRRRAQTEMADRMRYANRELISRILPALDNFDRALEVGPDSAGCRALQAGVRMVRDHLYEALVEFGLQPIEALGRTFDPMQHEAVECVHSDELDEGTVVSEFQKGYLIHDRLVRPSRVRVTTQTTAGNIRGGPTPSAE